MYPLNALQVVTDILKMCMKMFYAEKKIIFDKFTAFFNLVNFQPMHILNK